MRPWARWALWSWVVLLVVGWTVSWVAYPSSVLRMGGLPGSISLIVGCFLTTRVRGNLLGPVLFFGASTLLIYDIGTVGAHAPIDSPSTWPGEYLAAWVGVWTGPIAFLTLALTLLSLAGAIGTVVLGGDSVASSLALVTVVFVFVGAYVGYRVPLNPVGWRLALFGLVLGGYAFLETYALAGMPFGDWALWFTSMLWLPALVILVAATSLLAAALFAHLLRRIHSDVDIRSIGPGTTRRASSMSLLPRYGTRSRYRSWSQAERCGVPDDATRRHRRLEEGFVTISGRLDRRM